MFEQFIHFIHHFVQPTPEQLQELLTFVSLEKHPKNHFLIKVGQTADKIYFVNQGIVRHFYMEGEEEGTVWFSFENDLVSEVQSFVNQQPSVHNILTLTEVEVLFMRYQDLQRLYAAHAVWERFGRLTTEQYLIRQIDRSYKLLFKSAKEKYEEFISRSPDILQNIPLHHIASYIGVSFETLSRIRAKRT
jgi:CRP/FNR family transcriptional regulator, anaerobic regulatory protein